MQHSLFDSPLALRLYEKPWDIQAFRLGASMAAAQRAGRCEVGHSGCSNLPAIPHNSKQVNTPQKGK